MRRRSVSGNTSPNAGFLLVRAESRSSTKVSPRFHYAWGPIEHFAAQGVIKDSIWLARMGCLELKARVDIPVAGTMINVVNDRLRVEHPSNG